MIYKKFKDIEISALGMGAMRLPVIGGRDARLTKKRRRKWCLCHEMA